MSSSINSTTPYPHLQHRADVVIIGGGPAGIAAAAAAGHNGARVLIVDDNPQLGGQIWRSSAAPPPEAAAWLQQIQRAEITTLRGTRIVAQMGTGELLAESDEASHAITYDRLILATGARERFVPFPGWSLPNVVGVGGLQALVKGGYPIRGKAIVIAGTGPLLLAVAAALRGYGARVLLVAEQASTERLARFGLDLLRVPSKLRQAVALQAPLRGIPYVLGCYPVAAYGTDRLAGVTLRRGGPNSPTWDLPCDLLATGFHLVPNLELASLLGCTIRDGVIQVDATQRTSHPAIYAAGEGTGIGGVELALVEGQIAGYAATGANEQAQRLFRERERWGQFAKALNQTFALRPELAELAQPATLICRCEDVALAQIKACTGWRDAKLHTRVGMGPCQGRICGPVIEHLLGWDRESIRPPVFPCRLATLMQLESSTDQAHLPTQFASTQELTQ